MKDLNKIKFTANDVDGAYLLGIFNTGGIDMLAKELERIKKLGVKPHQILEMLKRTEPPNSADKTK